MTLSIEKMRRDQKGFTLVELAIVLIIIGLLIGGILKGQELINNAQVASTVAQMKGIDAAFTTFRDTYNALAGDMIDASTRLPNCAAGNTINCSNGGGNQRIDTVSAGNASSALTDENIQAWIQLSAASLLNGVNGAAGTPVTFGGVLPAANIGGGYMVGFFAGGDTLPAEISGGGNASSGHYVVLTGSPTQNVGAVGSTIVPASKAVRIDRKMDDGAPGSGSVIAADEGASGAGCTTGTPPIYDEQNNTFGCALYVHIQQ